MISRYNGRTRKKNKQANKRTKRQQQNENQPRKNMNSSSRILVARGQNLLVTVTKRLTHSTTEHKKVTCKARKSTCFGQPDETLSHEQTDNNAKESERSVSNAWSHQNPTSPGCFLHSSPYLIHMRFLFIAMAKPLHKNHIGFTHKLRYRKIVSLFTGYLKCNTNTNS